MTKQPTPVRIKAEFLEQLREYNKISGVPVSFCINEAVGNWIATRLPVLMERFEMPIQSVGIMHPPAPINPAKKDAAGKEWYQVMKEAGKPMRKPKVSKVTTN